VSAGGKLYLATSTLAAADKASSSTTSSSTTSSSTGYSRRPALVWAELAVKATTSGSDTCTQSRAGAASRQSWDASRDYSKEWDRMVRVRGEAAAAMAACRLRVRSHLPSFHAAPPAHLTCLAHCSMLLQPPPWRQCRHRLLLRVAAAAR
jgi:hypothetical protein